MEEVNTKKNLPDRAGKADAQNGDSREGSKAAGDGHPHKKEVHEQVVQGEKVDNSCQTMGNEHRKCNNVEEEEHKGNACNDIEIDKISYGE